ncbi:MAG: hypothetical protein QNJ46_23375 [Leptolyngbyaceae cyanobacterium MO_188.B28]|nr:hypothetical protein [Leptolyngbyaceae cyanobacterium MO_188.B28]
MNRNLSSILLINLLTCGAISAGEKSIQPFPVTAWRHGAENQASVSTALISAGYVPPNYGLPIRKEGGGARLYQAPLPTQVAPQRSLMGDDLRFSYSILT